MYLTEEILEKLNATDKTKNSSLKAGIPEKITLPDIIVRSFAEVKELTGDTLSWGEKNFLYQQAQKELKENKMVESRILSRSNPQLANAVRLGIRQSPMLDGYDDLFPQRAGSFVKPGSVASMFSPAGYLTELYREARDLHADTSQYHLDTRRPDLASLSLSQDNMDDELSTLALSNEVLLSNVEAKEDKDYDGVMEMLAAYRQTGATPYSQPYEAVRQAIILQDPDFTAFRNNPAVAAKMNTASLLGIQADIPPELHAILTEDISEDNADELIKKNFGDTDTSAFKNISYLARWFGLTRDEMSSLLGLVSTPGNITPGVQYYQNDQLVSLVESDSKLNAVLMTRMPGGNYSQFGYIELIPLSGDNYQLQFSVSGGYVGASHQVHVGTTGPRSSDLLNGETIPAVNAVLSLNVTLDSAKLTKGITIGVTRYQSDDASPYLYATVKFQRSEYAFNIFLLKLNKLIRLYKATGFSPDDIRNVIESSNNDLTITENVLSQLFRVNYYMKNYDLGVDAAMVLSGANIGHTAHGNQTSAFTRLFNTPPLNNKLFSADGSVLDLEPGKSDDTFRLGALKRALQVDDAGLYTLYTLTITDKDAGGNAIAFTTTPDNLSALYRTRLLAEVNQLTVTELSLLFSVSPYAGQKLDTLAGDALSGLPGALKRYTQWLKEMNWTVSDLYLMLTDSYSTVLSPDIQNLITTLKNGLSKQGLSGKNADLITAAAPFIAAATQLDSAEKAVAILQWLNQLKPQGLTVADFLGLVDNDSRTDEQTTSLVSFCQVMGQLALIVRNTGLSSQELAWGVAHPTIINEKATALGHDIATLHELTQLHAFLARCGTHASEILTSLSGDGTSEKNNLAVKTVATALALDEQVLQQALARTSPCAYFYSWIHLRNALQWLDVADTFGITPANVAAMTMLTYASPYADWVATSHALQAGLNVQQTAQLSATLDEALSAAASAYVIKNIAPSQVTDRDKLYGWLLIDNQVSAQIKTTRIAEAIASVQLYVNRALSGQEGSVDKAVKSRQFFSADWDTYNKRYSTWGGVSELVYYPENYVDPTLRIGQTSMMDEMLQTLSQSQINADTVEDGFKKYLTDFEEVANLKILSAYHDKANVNQGKTWFIGSSQTTPKKYYWRNVDHSKGNDGIFTANAWTEWHEISCAINPVEGFICPVRFNSRLYVCWIEKVKNKSDGGTSDIINYYLNLAHLRYDGSWSSPFSYDMSLNFGGVAFDAKAYGLYSAEYQDEGTLLIYIHSKKAEYSISDLPAVEGVYVYSDMSVGKIDDERAKGLVKLSLNQLDTISEVKASALISEIKSVDFQVGPIDNDGVFSIELQMDDIVTSASSAGELNVILSPEINVSYKIPCTDEQVFLSELASNSNLNKVYVCDGSKFRYIDAKNGIYSDLAFLITSEIQSLDEKIYLYLACYLTGEVPEPELSSASIMSGNVACDPIFSNFKKIYSDSNVSVYRAEAEKNPLMNLEKCNDLELKAKDRPDLYFRYYSDYGTLTPLIATRFAFEDVIFSIPGPASDVKTWSFSEHRISSPKFSLKKMAFTFGPLSFVVDEPWVEADKKIAITTSFSATNLNNNKSLGTATLTVTKNDDKEFIKLLSADDGAQYMASGVRRTRLNTLFARQLIVKADLGIDSILAMDTQKIQEPMLGKGFYAEFTLPPYNESIHGSIRAFTLNSRNIFNGDKHVVYSGVLTDNELNVKLFIPAPVESKRTGDDYIAKIFLLTDKTTQDIDHVGAHFKYTNSDKTAVELNLSISDISMFSSVVVLNNQTTEPMDFNGANALYFWELFYYSPMMVFKRLLNESKFTEATRWLHYIWNPAGYLVDGEIQDYYWNVRPLEEETTWHADPLDSVDPDAVSQADPLHYKVATFMSYLDLLIARGDQAYRQLERDTLNEAKMWYVQALDILGDEPYLAQGTGWASPRLNEAADKTTQKNVQQNLMAIRQPVFSGELRTANSLTGLFLPQQNEKLAGYWQTLNQRLYNLRHNLSIDGNPLSLSVYATLADPAALLSAAVNASSGGGDLPAAVMPLYRFPVILDSARSLVNQLTQFGSTLLSITERQDAEGLSELLQTQGSALVLQSIALQDKEIAALDADRAALAESRSGAQSRLDSYTTLYDEDVNTGEKQAMDLFLSSSVIADGGQAFHTTAGALDLAPNIFGLANGGSRWGAAFSALGSIAAMSASAIRTAGERISQSEAYRRRRQEWEIQRNAAQSDVKQIDAQLASLAVRHEAAVLQKAYLETQQAQTQAQMTFLQNKFTSNALYNWLRGKLAAIYYQFYDLTVSRCLMAQEAYKWSLEIDSATFIRPGAWQGTYAGLMAGETLMLNLTQMEQEYLKKEEREKEVTSTVCLSQFYAGLPTDAFVLADQVVSLVTKGSGEVGTGENTLYMKDKQLQARLKLADLKMVTDYPDSLGKKRRIKQISVTLPALTGPYQDVRAVLNYGGSVTMPRGCDAIAVSHGMNDSGQFQLDFNDSRWLPFEGIPVDDGGSLTLRFPYADSKQKDLLLSLTDIILHIRYTITG
ncbi:neuraminidase-like domain-containing protein [Pantoea agglomerans]|uniref:Tc toxin subunit A-related protein n=1 Tax=Enterobacter agglomerans TaxID=549 RepID=UPI003965D47A